MSQEHTVGRTSGRPNDWQRGHAVRTWTRLFAIVANFVHRTSLAWAQGCGSG